MDREMNRTVNRRTFERTCTVCPRGCRLTIEVVGDRVEITGNECPKGEDYGLEEATQPRRILTTTVRTTCASRPRLPVRTSEPVPLQEFPSLMKNINMITVEPPLACGAVIAADLVETGVNLVATDTLE